MQIIRKNRSAPVLREDWVEINNGGRVLLLRYPALEATGMVEHCFSTRYGGVSEGIYASMNLSFTRGDREEAVRQNYRNLAEAMGVSLDNFVLADQTHTVNVRKVTKEDAGKGILREKDYADVDGLITDEPGLVLATSFADCVPLYFVDPVHRAIGMSHSGWRGTVGRIGRVTVETMGREYGTRPEDLICAIGPSICQECYEVSEDVAQQFFAALPGHEAEIIKKGRVCPDSGEQKYQLDLWKANEFILTEAGVLPEHISVTDICTCCNPKVFFSHRASHGKRGGLGGFLCIKDKER